MQAYKCWLGRAHSMDVSETSLTEKIYITWNINIKYSFFP